MRAYNTWIVSCLVSVTWIAVGSRYAAGAEKPGWRHDFRQARSEAKRLELPLLVHFYATWCGPCRQMERSVLGSPDLRKQLGTSMIAVKVDSDRHPELIRRYNIRVLPSDVFLDPNGRILARAEGYQDKTSYLKRIARTQGQFTQSSKIQIAKNGNSRPRLNIGSNRNPVDGSNNAQADTGTAEKAIKPELVVGLKGYSPVSLAESRKWRRGRKEFAWTYKDIVYYMASAEELEEFKNNPARHAPRLLGCDAVVLADTDRAVPGDTKYGAFFDGELYLFVSRDSRERFKKNPHRFGRTRQVLRIDQLQRTVIR